jgi:hypothetical protein
MKENIDIGNVSETPQNLKPKHLKLTKEQRVQVKDRWEDFLGQYGNEKDEEVLRLKANEVANEFSEDIRFSVRQSFTTRIINRHKSEISEKVKKEGSVWYPVLEVAKENNITESVAVGKVRKLENQVRKGNKDLVRTDEKLIDLGVDEKEVNKATETQMGLLALGFIDAMKNGKNMEESTIKNTRETVWEKFDFYALTDGNREEIKPSKVEKNKFTLKEKAVLIAGVALAVWGAVRILSGGGEASTVSANEASIKGIAEASASKAKQAVTNTPYEAKSTSTATPEPTSTPDPLETRDRTGYMLGELDLRSPFEVSFPARGLKIALDPGVNMSQDGTSAEVAKKMADWRNYPNYSAVYNGDNQTETEMYTAFCHGALDTLPCDKLEEMDLMGEEMIVTQLKGDKIIITRMRVGAQKEVTYAEYRSISSNGYNVNDPAFLDLPRLGISQGTGLTLVECIGKVIHPDKDNPEAYDFSGRVLVSGKVFRQEVYDKSGMRVTMNDKYLGVTEEEYKRAETLTGRKIGE